MGSLVVVLLLGEQKKKWSLMIFSARATHMGSSVWSIWFLWFFWCGFRSGRQDGRDRPHEPAFVSRLSRVKETMHVGKDRLANA